MPTTRVLTWLTHQRTPTSILQFHDLTRELRWLLGFATIYALAALATGIVIRSYPTPLWGATDFTLDVWYVFGFKIVLLLVLPLVVYRRWGYTLTDLLHGWHLTWRSGIVFVLCFALGVLSNASRTTELKEAWAMQSPAMAFARAAVGIVLPWVVAAIPEEVVYRGLLQTRIEASWGRFSAVLLTVILFTAWHVPPRYLLANSVEGHAGDFGSVLMGTGVPVAVVGLILALAWDRWRNLPALIAIHAGIDTLPMMCSMLKSLAGGLR